MPDEISGTAAVETTETAGQGDAPQVEAQTPSIAQGATPTPNGSETPSERQERVFKQSEVDQILRERLAREKQSAERQLKSHPVLSYLEEKAKKLNISVEQLIEKDRQWEEQQKINELVQKNIPEEYARKLLEHDKLLLDYQNERKRSEAQQSKNKMYSDFIKAYPEVNNEDIPVEVWQEVQRGESLTNAYARFENKTLKEKLAAFDAQKQTMVANEVNAKTSPGSAKDGGKGQEDFVSQEQFEEKRSDSNWMSKNYSKVINAPWYKKRYNKT